MKKFALLVMLSVACSSPVDDESLSPSATNQISDSIFENEGSSGPCSVTPPTHLIQVDGGYYLITVPILCDPNPDIYKGYPPDKTNVNPWNRQFSQHRGNHASPTPASSQSSPSD